jgi:(p)ppGpp synthase/HD superfamily hydrolase
MEKSIATPRFLDALEFAVTLHGSDLRKKGPEDREAPDVPYVTHLLGVCALVLAQGGSEDEAMAALLHDSLEDHAGPVTVGLLRERFGDGAARIVVSCTDTPPEFAGGEKPDWRSRKEAYVRHLRTLSPGECIVSLADKLDNARSMVADYRSVGERLWGRFRRGADDQLWYFDSLVAAFRAVGCAGFLIEELERQVAELKRLSGRG